MVQFISLFLENKAKFQSGKFKGIVVQLSSCLFETLKVRRIRDQPLTDRQTDKLTNITLSHMHAED